MDAPPTLELSGKARTALDSICDTFVPGEDGLPSATELGVPEAMLMAVGSNPSEAEREQFAGLLDGVGHAAAGSDRPLRSLSRPSASASLLALGRRARGAGRGRPSRRCARASC